MQFWLNLAEPVRIACVFVAALLAAGQVNRMIYGLAILDPRPISPWLRRAAQAKSRTWLDCLPVVGWWFLRREEPHFGKGFWLRPMLLEFLLALGLAGLYRFEINGGLLPLDLAPVALADTTQQWQFLAHALLICLMTAATFIDFDEQMIPDEITVPGTLLGLIFVTLVPGVQLPVLEITYAHPPTPPVVALATLGVTSPLPRPDWLDGVWGLALGAALLAGCCVALVPATCTLRRGWGKALQFYLASFFRGRMWLVYLVLYACAMAGMIGVWNGRTLWPGLLNALCGMAIGGSIVWSVRIAGSLALKREAMGFGDVTLMGMIGAFLGWQPCLVIFFLSPVAALFIALTQWLVTGRRDIAFGPYLCLAAVFVLLGWPHIWHHYVGDYFSLGWFLPTALGVCLCLMAGLLMLWKILEELLFGPPTAD